MRISLNNRSSQIINRTLVNTDIFLIIVNKLLKLYNTLSDSQMNLPKILLSISLCTFSFVHGDTPTNEQLFKMLNEMQQQIEALQSRTLTAEAEATHAKNELSALKQKITESEESKAGSIDFENLIRTNAEYSYMVLDHTENTNTKQLRQLEALRDGDLKSRLTIGGNINALVNYQKVNTDSKFGWLMRHPTSENQFGNEVSEAVIHSVSLQVTGRVTDNLTAYAELLYNPEQNFAAGATITDLERNNINMRRAYLLYGDLASSPFYASIGKMDIPFGLNDTVNPFTNSTNWHSFAGLSYGAKVGYTANNWHLRAMAVQGGAQFRNANTSVHDSSVPSKLNNFALDANYTFEFDDDSTLLAGVSYQHGTAYCQDYEPHAPGAPGGVQHFGDCSEDNPGVAAYLKYECERLTLLAEYAQTLDEWPGTHNPAIPQFEAEKNVTFTLGASYDTDFGLKNPVTLSTEFSRFRAGDDGSDWEKQDQWVFGASYFLNNNIKLFAEYVHVDGWVPLNFLSGGNPGGAPGESWSDQDSTTDAVVLGVTAAF